jgi:hypothetical protein
MQSNPAVNRWLNIWKFINVLNTFKKKHSVNSSTESEKSQVLVAHACNLKFLGG